MLEELDSCQVRDTSYYTYLLLRLSWHCGGWFGELPSMYLDERNTMCVCWTGLLTSSGRMQCDHSVWNFAEGATLPCFETLQMIEVSDTT